MSKLFTKFIIISVLFFTINLMVACLDTCPDTLGYYLESVDTKALDVTVEADNTERYFYTDTLRSQVVFETTPLVSFAAKTKIPSLINTAYGCDVGEVLNPIDPSASSLTANRAIYFRSDRTQAVHAFTNLLQEPKIMDFIAFPNELLYDKVSETVLMHQDLIFEKAEYTFYFEWKSRSGVTLTDSVNVFMDLP